MEVVLGMFKGHFALNIATNVLLEQNTPVLMFSLKESKEQVINRILSSQSLIKYDKIANENLTNEEWSSIVRICKQILNLDLYIDDTSNISIKEIEEKSLKMKLEKSMKLIVIDSLQLIKNDDTEIIIKLKRLAKELDITILVTFELSQEIEKRKNKRPYIIDIGNKKMIGNADVIMLLYKDKMYNKQATNDNTEVIIAKNYNGKTGIVKLLHINDYCKFVDIEKVRTNIY